VLVAGAGTLGGAVIPTLALAGVGMTVYGGALTISDFDRLEEVNRTRWMLGIRPGDLGRLKAEVAAERARELNPDVNAVAWPGDVVYQMGAAALLQFDVIFLCVDNLKARLHLSRYAEMWADVAQIPIIEGGLDGLSWAIHTFIPGRTACYECTMSEEEYAELRRRYSCQGQALAGNGPPIPMSIVSAVPAAGVMAQEAVQILCGLPPAYAGRELRFDAQQGQPARVLQTPQRNRCPGHRRLDLARTLALPFTAATPVAELRQLVGERLRCPADKVTLVHDQSILYAQECLRCGYRTATEEQPTLFDLAPLAPCPQCGNPDLRAHVSQHLLRDERTLAEHGVPEEHVLRAYTPEGSYFLVPSAAGVVLARRGYNGFNIE
jgi:adenylyltransferase/sulfurtransferase